MPVGARRDRWAKIPCETPGTCPSYHRGTGDLAAALAALGEARDTIDGVPDAHVPIADVAVEDMKDRLAGPWHDQHIETPDTLAIEDARNTHRALYELMPQVEAWLDANPSVPQT